jgi:hypothetical protein
MPHVITGQGSIDRRPDAFSSNYLFAHAWGPVQLSDFSLGLYNRAWRVRVDNTTHTFYLARANDTNDAWEAETVVFAFAGTDVLEMDACFDQQGRVFVCAERPTGAAGASEIWAYYFDPIAGAYTFVSKGAGRTPKCVLDDVIDPNIGDILLFYVNPVNGVCWRQQRDRYNVEAQMVFGNLVSVGPLHFTLPYGPGSHAAVGQVSQNAYYALGAGPPFLFTSTNIRANDPGPLGNVSATVEIHFTRPIDGFEFEAVSAHFDGGTAWAINAAGGVIGTVAYPSSYGPEGPRPRRSFYAPGIRQIWLLPSAADYTSFDNIWIAPTESTYVPPAPSAIYLEDAFKAEDGRVHLLYSVRDVVSGQFQLLHYESLLYPIHQPNEDRLTLGASIGQPSTLRRTLIVFDSSGTYIGAYPQMSGDDLEPNAAINLTDNILRVVLIQADADVESILPGASFNPGENTLIATGGVVYEVTEDPDSLKLGASFGAGDTLVAIAILYTAYDVEGIKPSAGFGPGGTLV